MKTEEQKIADYRYRIFTKRDNSICSLLGNNIRRGEIGLDSIKERNSETQAFLSFKDYQSSINEGNKHKSVIVDASDADYSFKNIEYSDIKILHSHGCITDANSIKELALEGRKGVYRITDIVEQIYNKQSLLVILSCYGGRAQRDLFHKKDITFPMRLFIQLCQK